MTGVDQHAGGEDPAVDGATPDGADATELIAQIRQLAAGPDPAGVQQVIADVLTALDRATGGALREQLPDTVPFGSVEQRSADQG